MENENKYNHFKNFIIILSLAGLLVYLFVYRPPLVEKDELKDRCFYKTMELYEEVTDDEKIRDNDDVEVSPLFIPKNENDFSKLNSELNRLKIVIEFHSESIKHAENKKRMEILKELVTKSIKLSELKINLIQTKNLFDSNIKNKNYVDLAELMTKQAQLKNEILNVENMLQETEFNVEEAFIK